MSWDCPGLRSLFTDAATCPGHRLLSLGARRDHPRVVHGQGIVDLTASSRPSPEQVGARHRHKCIDLVLRFDFGGGWHRPTRTLRIAAFEAPISRPRSPREPPLTLSGPLTFPVFSAENPESVRNGTPDQRAPPSRVERGQFHISHFTFRIHPLSISRKP